MSSVHHHSITGGLKRHQHPTRIPVRISQKKAANGSHVMHSINSKSLLNSQQTPATRGQNLILNSSCSDLKLCSSSSSSVLTNNFRCRKQLQYPSTSTPNNRVLKWNDELGASSDDKLPLINACQQQQFNETIDPISEEVLKEWLKCLEKNFKVSFGVEIFNYVKNANYTSVINRLDSLLAKNFKMIVENDDYLKAEFDFIMHLFHLDNLDIKSEVEVFNAAMRWLTFNWTKRKELIPHVLGEVRFALMSDDDCVKCLSQLDTETLGLLPVCQDILFKSLVYKMTQHVGQDEVFSHMAPVPRTQLQSVKEDKVITTHQPSVTNVEKLGDACNETYPKRKTDGAAATLEVSVHDLHLQLAILVFGGFRDVDSWENSQTGSDIYGLKSNSKSWKLVGKMPEPRAYLAATVLEDKIYISGGYDPKDIGKGPQSIIKASFWCLDTKSTGWQMLSPMVHARAHHSMVTVLDRIYVIGGQGSSGTPLDAVECYDLCQRFWKEVSHLPVPCLGTATCEYQGNIWICGGISTLDHNPRHGKIVETVLVFDPTRNLWHYGVPLRIPRAFANLVDFDGKLTIIGGITVTDDFNNGLNTSVSAVDSFNLHSQKWALKSDLLVPRHGSASVVAGQRLFVIGGISSGISKNVVECFDGTIRQWIPDVVHLSVPVYGAAAVVFPTY